MTLLKSPADYPEWKWVARWELWTLGCDLVRKTTQSDPNNFDLHVCSSWLGYAVNSIIAEVIIDASKEPKKKDASVQHMRVKMVGLSFLLRNDDLQDIWRMTDAGEGLCDTNRLIGCAFITVLNEIDRAGQLKPNYGYRDLASVMSLYLVIGQKLLSLRGRKLPSILRLLDARWRCRYFTAGGFQSSTAVDQQCQGESQVVEMHFTQSWLADSALMQRIRVLKASVDG